MTLGALLLMSMIFHPVLRQHFVKEVFLLILLGGIFYVGSLLFAFAFYFVVWHSIPSLKDQLKFLRSEYKVDGPEFSHNKIINEYWDYDDEARAKAEQIAKDVLMKFEGKGRDWHGHDKKAKKNKH